MKVCKNCHTSCLDERVHCTQCGGTNFYLSKVENAGKGSNKEKVLKRILFGVMGIAIIVILLSAGSIFICSRQAEKKNTENGDVVSPIVVNKASDGNDLEEYTAKKYTEFLEKLTDKFEKAEAKYTVIKAQQDTEETEDSGNEQENDEGKKSSIVKEQPYNVREKNSAVENNTMYDSVEGMYENFLLEHEEYYYYAILDINKDGVPELLAAADADCFEAVEADSDDFYGTGMADVYTIEGNEIKSLGMIDIYSMSDTESVDFESCCIDVSDDEVPYYMMNNERAFVYGQGMTDANGVHLSEINRPSETAATTEMVYSTTLIGAKYSFYDDRQIAYAESVLLDGNQLTILGSMEMVSAEDFYNGEAAEYQEYQEYQEWNFELTDETVYNNGSELDPSMPEGKAFLTDEGILHSGLALYFSVQNGVVKEITLSP